MVCTELYDATQFLHFAELIKLHGTELDFIVGPEALHLLSCLLFDHNLPLLKGSKYIALMLEDTPILFWNNHQLKSEDN